MKKFKKNKGPEHHLTFVKETDIENKYITHRIIPNMSATDVIAEYVVAVKAVFVDNTTTNIGCEAELVRALEEKLKRMVHTIGCFLYQN